MTEHEKIRLFLTGKRRIPLYEAARICANESPVSETPEKSEMVEIFESVLHTACDDGTLRYTDPYICSSVAIISLGYDKRNFYDIEIDDLREWARKNDIRCYFNDEALANGDTKLDTQKPREESVTDEKDSGTESDIAKHSDNGTTPDYLNPKCREYPPKLAAAVKAWEYARDNYKTDKRKRTPKTLMLAWLQEHATEYPGTLTNNGKPCAETIKGIAKVANWSTKGGSPKLSN